MNIPKFIELPALKNKHEGYYPTIINTDTITTIDKIYKPENNKCSVCINTYQNESIRVFYYDFTTESKADDFYDRVFKILNTICIEKEKTSNNMAGVTYSS